MCGSCNPDNEGRSKAARTRPSRDHVTLGSGADARRLVARVAGTESNHRERERESKRARKYPRLAGVPRRRRPALAPAAPITLFSLLVASFGTRTDKMALEKGAEKNSVSPFRGKSQTKHRNGLCCRCHARFIFVLVFVLNRRGEIRAVFPFGARGPLRSDRFSFIHWLVGHVSAGNRHGSFFRLDRSTTCRYHSKGEKGTTSRTPDSVDIGPFLAKSRFLKDELQSSRNEIAIDANVFIREADFDWQTLFSQLCSNKRPSFACRAEISSSSREIAVYRNTWGRLCNFLSG